MLNNMKQDPSDRAQAGLDTQAGPLLKKSGSLNNSSTYKDMLLPLDGHFLLDHTAFHEVIAKLC